MNSHCIQNARATLLEKNIFCGNDVESRAVDLKFDIRISTFLCVNSISFLLILFCTHFQGGPGMATNATALLVTNTIHINI